MFLGEVTFSNIQHYEITGDKKNDISNCVFLCYNDKK